MDSLFETVITDLAGSMPLGLGSIAESAKGELIGKIKPYQASYLEMLRLFPERRAETDVRYATAVQQLARKYLSTMLGVDPESLVVTAVTLKVMTALKQHRAWPELAHEYSFLTLL